MVAGESFVKTYLQKTTEEIKELKIFLTAASINIDSGITSMRWQNPTELNFFLKMELVMLKFVFMIE